MNFDFSLLGPLVISVPRFLEKILFVKLCVLEFLFLVEHLFNFKEYEAVFWTFYYRHWNIFVILFFGFSNIIILFWKISVWVTVFLPVVVALSFSFGSSLFLSLLYFSFSSCPFCVFFVSSPLPSCFSTSFTTEANVTKAG